VSKRPDNFADEGAVLPYGSNVSAPSIQIPDTKLFKTERGMVAKNYFDERISDLQKEYNAIVELAQNTELVYNAKYNFIPRVGHVYHLYNNNNSLFLSLISPTEWDKYECLGSYRFTTDATWEKT